MRKLTLAAALGGVLAVSALVGAPAFAQSENLDPADNGPGPYANGYVYSYGYTTYPNGSYTYMTNPAPAQAATVTTYSPAYVAPTYVAPAYVTPAYVTPTVVPVTPQASSTTTYTSQPYGQTTTTYTTTSPVVTYAPVYPQPSVATTTVYVAPPCNPHDINRPGVSTGCQ